MENETAENTYLIKLRRLWKGTLYIGIVALVIAIIVAVFLVIGWQASLLAIALIALSQLFRYIASEVDRIGWVLRTANHDEAESRATTRLRRTLLLLLILLVQLPVVGLFLFVAMRETMVWSVSMLVALIFIELMFQEIRRVNRQVAYRDASYGLDERPPLVPGHANNDLNERKDVALQDKLDRLERMMEEGLISRKAFEKACDKYRVRAVME